MFYGQEKSPAIKPDELDHMSMLLLTNFWLQVTEQQLGQNAFNPQSVKEFIDYASYYPHQFWDNKNVQIMWEIMHGQGYTEAVKSQLAQMIVEGMGKLYENSEEWELAETELATLVNEIHSSVYN